jgi:hypothetical protein
LAGQVDPELKAPHQPVFLFRHFRMDDAAPRRHPLHAAGIETARMTLIVAMAHAARQHIGHGLEAAMRMLGKAGDVIGGIVRAEFVQHQEWIDVIELRRADEAVELHPRAVADRNATHDARYRPQGHSRSIHVSLLRYFFCKARPLTSASAVSATNLPW